MNKTVQLVNEWAAFEKAHPDADIEAFCRYYLTSQREARKTAENFQGRGIPPSPASYLMKLLGYISRVFEIFMTRAMSDIPDIKQPEDFYFLNNIAHNGECRKLEVTQQQLMGYTTGIDTINRLLANGLIEERTDPTDKRARLIKATEKGARTLHACYQRAGLVNSIMFRHLSDDDIKLCITLLRDVEINNTALVYDLREYSVQEVYERLFPGGQKGLPLMR